MGSSIINMFLRSCTQNASKLVEFVTKNLGVCSKIFLYFSTRFTERAKNWNLGVTFHGLSNGTSHFEYKKFQMQTPVQFGRLFRGPSLKWS